MADRLEKLKLRRDTIRAMTTKHLQKAEAELGAKELDKEALGVLLDQLEDKEAKLKTLNSEIEEQITVAELEQEVTTAEEFQEKIICCKRKIFLVLQEKESGSSKADKEVQEITVKLPRLTLQKYSGDSCGWQNFWGQYEAAIHQNPKLTQVDKFNYLCSYLEGKAASAVAGLALTKENYTEAIKILTERFGRKDAIINSHMSKLLNLKPIKNSSDVCGLRKLYDSCELQIRSLQTLGIVSKSYGTLLCPILAKLLPQDINLEYSRKKETNTEWDVLSLLEFLKKEIESRERVGAWAEQGESTATALSSETKIKPKNANLVQGAKSKYTPSTAALSTNIEANQCLYCEKTDHNTAECDSKTVAEKKEIIKKKGRCFICLKERHRARFCRSRRTCAKCRRRHHTSICEESEDRKEKTEKPANEVLSTLNETRDKTNTIFLQTALVSLWDGEKEIIARCMFDGGSSRSFICQNLSSKLGLKTIETEEIKLHTFGNKEPENTERKRVELTLSNKDDPEKNITIQLLETPHICSALIHVPDQKLQNTMKEKGLSLADKQEKGKFIEKDISILIGADFYWQLMTGKIEKLNESLVAMESLFGWTIHGPSALTSNLTITEPVTVMHVTMGEINDEEFMTKGIKSLWELDALGIKTSESVNEDNNNKETMKKFESKISFEQNRYKVGLPWRQDLELETDNYELAERRFENLTKRFVRDPSFFTRYSQVIEEYLKQGIIEVIEKEKEQRQVSGKIYYLPHQAVIKENRQTTSLRVVFDASAHKTGYPSLNDCLDPGPNLIPDLLVVLLRFRTYKIAFVADIEKAFLQIPLREEDRDVTRFLWLEGPPSLEKQNKKVYRMTRVLFGVKSSPFLLGATVKHHIRNYEQSHPETFQLLNENLYIDDLIGGSDDVEKAFKLSTEAKDILASAKMTLRKWQSNSEILKEKWTETKLAVELESSESNEKQNSLKILGLKWNTGLDVFSFDTEIIPNLENEGKTTKRLVLQITAKIFDPIGILAPFTITAKCLFQILWERGIKWDEPIPDDLQMKWNFWCSQIAELPSITIPRFIYTEKTEENNVFQIHCFCDASEKAYGACVYVRIKTLTETRTCLVTAKSKVAPLKQITIPRLELMAALVGARIVNHIKEIFKQRTVTFLYWTDSMITFHWIKQTARQWKPFVANRVSEIKTLSEPDQWNHCEGKENPADLLSRGITVEQLRNNNLWFHGPTWLKQEEEFWRKTGEKNVSAEAEEEINAEKKTTVTLKCTSEIVKSPLFEIRNKSKLKKVLRITAWINRFAYNTRNPKEKKNGELTTDELQDAENFWIKEVQRTAFAEEIKELSKKKPVREESKLAGLNPFIDDSSILRVGGRLQETNFTFREKHPVILPRGDKFTELLIEQHHDRMMHSGISDTLSSIREKFWILQGRREVKRTIHKCLICRRFRTKPLYQKTAPLPKDRVLEEPAFSVTGIDFCGPVYIKENKINRKAYICLYTCAVTRAVHLELLNDLTTERFLLSFRRFISRRGVCHTVWTDNAKTFKRAEKELKNIWEKGLKTLELQQYFGNAGIKWKYIIERAPSFGGFYERLVRSVKTSLKKVLGKALLQADEMETALTEVEAVINSRPITYVYDNPDEPTPLTPSHFLIGQRLNSLPSGNIKEIDGKITRKDLTRRMSYRNTLLTRFWSRWKKEYLCELRSAHYKVNTEEKCALKVDDVVLISDHNLARHMWRLGVIEEAIKGRDGLVRAYTIRLPTGTKIKRPTHLIYPMEISG